MEAREHTKANLDLLRQQLDGGRMRAARVMVNSLHPSEVARLLESLPLKKRAMLSGLTPSLRRRGRLMANTNLVKAFCSRAVSLNPAFGSCR